MKHTPLTNSCKRAREFGCGEWSGAGIGGAGPTRYRARSGSRDKSKMAGDEKSNKHGGAGLAGANGTYGSVGKSWRRPCLGFRSSYRNSASPLEPPPDARFSRPANYVLVPVK